MRVLWVCVLFLTATYICGSIVDPDLWWHITAGRWILSNLAIPDADHWNMFAIGQPWRAYSWSAEILFALVDRYGGDQGLLALKLALALLFVMSLMFCLGRMANNWFFGGFLGVFTALAAHNHFTLRPQTISWLLLVWLILVADLIDKEGLNKIRGLALIVLMAIWANTNLTSLLGIVTVLFWLIGPGKLIVVGKAASLMVVGTILTPYKGAEWLTFFSKTGHPLKYASIAEFQAATILQYSTGFLIIIAAILLLWLHTYPRVISTAKLVLALGFVLVSLAVVKFIPLACIVLAALVARLWSDQVSRRLNSDHLAGAFCRLESLLGKVAGNGLGFLLIALAVFLLRPVWQQPISREIVPVESMDFIIENNLPHPILNDFGRGGYVMYRLSNLSGEVEHPVAIDGRTNVTPPDIMEKFKATFDGRHNWRDFVDLVNPGTIIWRIDSPFTTILAETGQWCVVHHSGSDRYGYQVFVRRDLLDVEYRHLEPKNVQCL